MARKGTHVRRPERYVVRESSEDFNPLRDRINAFVEEHRSLALDDSFDARTLRNDLETFIRTLLMEERRYVIDSIQQELDGLEL